MFVTFYNRAINTKTDEAGLPFYEDKVFVIIARDMTNQVDREATQEDFDRFPETYSAFLKANTKVEHHEGLILEMWPMVTPAEVMNLKSHGLYTVQQLAKTSKNEKPPYVHVLVEKVKNYVKIAGVAGLTSEKIDELYSTIELLREENTSLRAELTARMKPKEEAA